MDEFLQARQWGEFQEKFGLRVWRLVDDKSKGRAVVIERRLPLGKKYLYVSRGPSEPSMEGKIVELARKERAIFVRIEPPVPLTKWNLGEGWRKAERDIQPRQTLILDLDKSEAELLAGMSQKTRYNIRLAEKKGVTVRFSQDLKDAEHFLRLKREVEARGRFRFHPDEYYRKMLDSGKAGADHGHSSRQLAAVSGASPASQAGSPQPAAEKLSGPSSRGLLRIEVALAEHERTVLAAHVLVYFGDTVTYLHGASSSKKRNLMAPHLLQWESIKRARGLGYKYYDFWGVAPERSKDKRGKVNQSKLKPHPWEGITRFKEGFGGERVEYPGAYDYVISPFWYWIFQTLRSFRKRIFGR